MIHSLPSFCNSMATTPQVLFHELLTLCTTFLLFPSASNAHPLLKACHFDQIYQLGDSIADTGNLIRESPMGAVSPFARFPYGETFFRNPTGRCSNGLLMIDYLALAAGLPLLNPYKNMGAYFRHGVNFAVAGSTALPVHMLADKNIASPLTNSSLDVQLDWMSTHFNSICYNDGDCLEKLKNSLFMVGEIGGNDYYYALFQRKTIEEVKSMVPDVVQTITEAVRSVIHYGAVRVVVPGNFPIGCLPVYLTGFQTNDTTAYDEHQCLVQLNKLSMYHNYQLQQAIGELREEFPNASIIYGDYYNAFRWLFQKAPRLGFEAWSMQKACCGTGGDYNLNLMRMCGAPGVPVCPNPNKYISWDGVHLTQKAYRIMAGRLVRDILPQLHCSF